MTQTKRHNEILFTIDGDGVSPSTIGLRELADVFQNFESAVAATAKSKGSVDSEDLQLSLVKVADKCDELTLVANDVMYAAAKIVTKAVARNVFDEVPVSGHDNLRQLWKRAKATGHSYRISSPSNGLMTATISPDKELLLPVQVTGRTVLLATLDRVGGASNPTAAIILMNGVKLTVELENAEMAKRLGQRIFQVVSLEGEATWDSRTWQIEKFLVTHIGEFRDSPAIDAFREVAAAAGNRWDNIDPKEFVAGLRDE